MLQSEPIPSSVVARSGRAGDARLASERVGNRTALAHIDHVIGAWRKTTGSA